jgi:vitamin B12 transporter
LAQDVFYNVECKTAVLKYLLLYCAILLTLPLGAQMSFIHDTISIGEVVINGTKGKDEPAGYKTAAVDSFILDLNPQMSLAEILSQYSPVFIKSYGMGGTASPSFRGTGAGHTRLTWNGISVSNPMLGQSDLSLYPAGLTDEIQIYYGGASMPVSSGGIGGIINLETAPVWRKETSLSLNNVAGSFGQYSGLLRARAGNSVFQSVTKGYYQSAENDFPYLNTTISNEPVWQKRSNSQVIQRGFMQEFYIKRGKSTSSARVWYGSANRNLPSSMLVQQPGLQETQFDESLRSMLSFDHYGDASKLSLVGACLVNRLNYTNSLAAVDSRNLTRTIVMKTEYGHDIGKSFRIRSTVTEELNYITTNNYEGNVRRNNLSVDVYSEKGFGERISSSFLVREILDASKFLIPDFTAGLQYRLLNSRDWFLKANVSRNSRIPSLNDLYWLPGGNTDLRNEYAFMYEITAEVQQDLSVPIAMKLNISAFMNNIRDMIQWLPGDYSYWTAQNIKSVNTSGIESSGSLNYRLGRLNLGFNANYSYTRATTVSSGTHEDASVGRQLVYIPVHQANCFLLAGYGRFYSSWNMLLNSRRYLNVENTSYLPGYILNNLLAGVRFRPKKFTLDFSLHIDNIFDISYQTIAYYPLPGRSFSLKLLLQILN